MVPEGIINAVAKLKEKGYKPEQIASRLSLNVSVVQEALTEVKKDLGEGEDESDTGPELTNDMQEAFQPIRKRRGRPPKIPSVGTEKPKIMAITPKISLGLLDKMISELEADIDVLRRAREILSKSN